MRQSVTPIDYRRQRDIVDQNALSSLRVLVIGAGGIGSPTTVSLAKLGVRNITVMDDDRLEAHNLPSQFYSPRALGEYKVNALAGMVHYLTGTIISIDSERFHSYNGDRYAQRSDIIISGVDSMQARKDIWDIVKQHDVFYIDGRMAAEMTRIYALNTSCSILSEQYEETLYSDAEAVDLPCTARATVYCCWMIAALITNIVKRYANEEHTPFETIFDFATMQCIVTE